MKQITWVLGEKRLDYRFDDKKAEVSLSDKEGVISKVDVIFGEDVKGDGILVQHLSEYQITDKVALKRAIVDFVKNYNVSDNVVVMQSQSSDNIITDSLINELLDKLNSESIFSDASISVDNGVVYLKTDYAVEAMFDFNTMRYEISHSGTVEESGDIRGVRDLDEILKILYSFYHDYCTIDAVMDSLLSLNFERTLQRVVDFIAERYSKDELLANPPKYVKDEELWKVCVDEVTDYGKNSVPLSKPLLYYKSRVKDSDENHRNEFNKIAEDVFGKTSYLSWKDGNSSAVLYVGDVDIAEIKTPENRIEKVEIWNYRFMDKMKEFLKRAGKVSDSVIHYNVKVVTRVTDAVDTQLLKSIVDANLQHYGVQGYVLTTSGGTVRVKVGNDVVATITDKGDDFEVNTAPQCSEEIKKALEEIKSKGSNVIKEDDGSIKKSFKDISSKVYSVLKGFTKSVTSGMGKDAEQAVTGVLGPAGVIANTLVTTVADLYKNRDRFKSKKS